MKHTLSVGMLALIPIAVIAEDTKKIPKALKGTWVVTKTIRSGEEYDRIVGDQVTFGSGSMTIISKRGRKQAAKFTLNLKTKPIQMDLTLEKEDQPSKGLLEIKGDVLRVCFGEPGKPRPKELKSQEGSDVVLITLKRVKSKK